MRLKYFLNCFVQSFNSIEVIFKQAYIINEKMMKNWIKIKYI